MRGPDIFRVAAIVVLIGVCIGTLAAIDRRPITSSAPDGTRTYAHNGVLAELHRCRAHCQQHAEDPRCQAVWEENRRRFFGTPARPQPPTAAPVDPISGDPQ
jgi:conjugative transfer region protein TrbK